MDFRIEKITAENYNKFDDMIYWRMNSKTRILSNSLVNDSIIEELKNPNLHIFAVDIENIYVAWISLIYVPKVGRFNGRGHIYVDELWVEPSYRNKGLAKSLMTKADELVSKYNAVGIRLYVNIDNQNAQKLYEDCGFGRVGTAVFMEK